MADQQYKLSEDEIDAIVDRLCEKFEKKLYVNLGKGVLGIFWKALIVVLIAIAGYGAGIHWFK